MTKGCPLCKRTSLLAGGYSNRIRATKFNPTGTKRRHLNLQWTRIGSGRRIRICTRCLKANRHLGTSFTSLAR